MSNFVASAFMGYFVLFVLFCAFNTRPTEPDANKQLNVFSAVLSDRDNFQSKRIEKSITRSAVRFLKQNGFELHHVGSAVVPHEIKRVDKPIVLISEPGRAIARVPPIRSEGRAFTLFVHFVHETQAGSIRAHILAYDTYSYSKWMSFYFNKYRTDVLWRYESPEFVVSEEDFNAATLRNIEQILYEFQNAFYRKLSLQLISELPLM
jgi:hypothetical protein